MLVRPFQASELWEARHELALVMSAGIAPHLLAGEKAEPSWQAWDEVDVALINAWGDLQEKLCSKCGRPREMHKTDKVTDYRPAFYSCTAAEALDDFQTKWVSCSPELPAQALMDARRDRGRREDGYRPDASREWFTWHILEGPPD